MVNHRVRLAVLAALTVLGSLLGPKLASAATIELSGSCSLAQAIKAVNQRLRVADCIAGDGQSDTILAPQSTVYRASNLPQIEHDVIIKGAGNGWSGTTIETQDNYPLYLVGHVNLTLSDLTFTTINGVCGRGIVNEYSSSTITLQRARLSNFKLGGIWSQGQLTIYDSTIDHNGALSGTMCRSGSGVLFGGGVYAGGARTDIRWSTIDHNSGNIGGGIYNSHGTLQLWNSTLAANIVTHFNPEGTGRDKLCVEGYYDGLGGGLYGGGLAAGGYYDIRGSTVVENAADCGGGMYFGGTLPLAILSASIVALNTSFFGYVPDYFGGIAEFPCYRVRQLDLGSVFGLPVGSFAGIDPSLLPPSKQQRTGTCNIFSSLQGISRGESSASFVGDPKLNAFAANGGYNWTYLPRSDSPAVDAAGGQDAAFLLSSPEDERHVSRPRGARADIGAVEL